MPNPEKRDLDLTGKQLEAWFRKRLPRTEEIALSGLAAPSDTGFSSTTLLFELTYQQDGKRRSEGLVARLEPTGFAVFPSYDMGLQFRVMMILGDTDVPVPHMRWLEEDEGPLGVPFYVMDRVRGRVPSDNPPMHTAGWVADLSPEDRRTLWWNGFEAMTRVHRLDWKSLGFDFLDQPERGSTPLAQQLHYYDEYVDWGLERGRYPLIERALAWLHANAPVEESVALCWGDSRLANQIFDGLSCVAVIDWEMVRLGDPVQDLAWWLASDRCFTEGLGVERLAGLPDRAATIARWEALTGREARHFAYWEVLVLLRFSVNMARIGLQMKHYGVLPPDHEMDVVNLGSQTLAWALETAEGG
jgi:aminoglycoside phosphotransferase (APT) family kinase protein